MSSLKREAREEIDLFRKKVIDLISRGINQRREIESSLMTYGISRKLSAMVKLGMIDSVYYNKRDKHGNKIVIYSIGTGKKMLSAKPQKAPEEIPLSALFSIWQIPLPKGGSVEQFNLSDKRHNECGIYKTEFGIQSSMG